MENVCVCVRSVASDYVSTPGEFFEPNRCEQSDSPTCAPPLIFGRTRTLHFLKVDVKCIVKSIVK